MSTFFRDFGFGRMTQDLDVDPINFESAETAFPQSRLDEVQKVVVKNVPVDVVHRIVQVQMIRCGDIEVHFAVRTHPMVINPQKCKLGKDVVYGCHCYGSPAGRRYVLRHHVGRSVSQLHHRLVDRYPLRGGLQAMTLQEGAELIHRGGFLCLVHHTGKRI